MHLFMGFIRSISASDDNSCHARTELKKKTKYNDEIQTKDKSLPSIDLFECDSAQLNSERIFVFKLFTHTNTQPILECAKI